MRHMGLSKVLDEDVFLLPRWIEGLMLDVNFPLLNWRWDYENQLFLPFEDMLRIGRSIGLLCNYCCLSDGSDFWAHIGYKRSTSHPPPIK